MWLFSSCKRYLGFDDRLLMLFGIPLLSVIMPLILKEYLQYEEDVTWVHYILETFFYVLGYWIYFRWLSIVLRKKFPDLEESGKRILYEIIIFLVSAPLLKFVLTFAIKSAHLCYTDPSEEENLLIVLNIYFPTALILTIYEAGYYFVQYRESLIEPERMQRVHVQTELENLRNQINPHFLFNSLNTLMNLISSNPDSAQSYLSKLSRFYRYTVSANDEPLIPISKELECAKLYVELLKERFGEALKAEVIEFKGEDKLLPPLSLQLLIENAVKHNIVSTSSPLSLKIEIDEKSDYVKVINNIQLRIEEVKSTGMGIKNIAKRFSFFTQKALIISNSNGLFEIQLPLVKKR